MTPTGRFAEGAGLELYGWSKRYYVSGNMAGWTSGGHYTRGYWGELSQFARAVLGQAEPAPGLADGLEALRIIEAMLASWERGAAVGMSELRG
jgi:predicted dehydrogenase